VAATNGAVLATVHTSKVIFWILGGVLFLAGVLTSGILSSHLLPQRWQHIGRWFSLVDRVGAFALGAFFGLLTMPACPAGLGLTGSSAGTAQATSLPGETAFISFALGLGVPILAVGLLTTILKPDLTKRLRRYMCSIEQKTQLLCGNLLMILGIYFVVVG